MTKRFLSLFVLLFVSTVTMLAQFTVQGTVTDENGAPIPGANVILRNNTTVGTITDSEGKYKLDVKKGDVTITFSFIGYKQLDVPVNNQKIINAKLIPDTENIDEVVVTALGLKKKEKTLTYSQQTIGANELSKSSDSNFLNSLSGKAAGVDIKKSSSGIGGSTRMVLRGSKSLSGDSEPLYVIDGIPMVNNKGGQPGMWGGTDGGDGLSQINPDDIENISFLKGSNAAVLYGSQGANGVVLITTKSGKEGKARVNITSGVSFENVMKKRELQFDYGSESGAKESWSTTKGDYDDTFVDDFFNTGVNFTNSFSVSGGTKKTQAYFSYANTHAKGITPNNSYNKNNITFKQSTKILDDKVTLSSNIMLSSEVTDNRIAAGYYLNPLTGLYFFPRNGIKGKDFDYYKNNYEIFDSNRNMMLQNWFVSSDLQSNPYWIVNKEPREDKTKRIIANFTADWSINKHLSFTVRGNYDFADKLHEQRHYAGTNSTNAHENGRWDYNKYTDELIYADGILKYDNKFGDFSLNVVAGASYQKATYGLGVSVNQARLIYANEFYMQNLHQTVQVHSTLSSRYVKQGLFANTTVGFKDMLFLDLAGRKDWASTLAGTPSNSYFYPAIGLTAIISEMASLPDWISFAKARASYTTVANPVPFNKVNPQNTISSSGGVDRNTKKPFDDLKPEMLRSMEFGLDWRFFKGRIGLDFTYYNINSQDQFFELTAPSGSGYTRYFVNAGEIVNKGVELTVRGIPIQNKNVTWSTSFNFAKNNNEVVELHPDITQLNLGSSEGYSARIMEGGSIGDLYVHKFRKDDQGRLMLDENNKPLKTKEKEYIGNLEPEWSLGWNNSISYRNFSLNVMINSKIGGKVFSQTESLLDGYGVSKRTGDARDAGGVKVNAINSKGQAVSTIDAETYYFALGNRNGIGEAYVYDRTNIRLSQLSLSYNFDVEKLNLPFKNLSLSVVGQNLFFFYVDAPFDPEAAMSTNRNSQSLDNFLLPSTRNWGFNLKLTF